MTKQRQLENYRKPNITFQVFGIILASIFIIASAGLVWLAACDTQHGEIPNIFGWSVCSSNGEYEAIPRDSFLIIRLAKGNANYREGNVVAFYYPNAATSTKVYLGSVAAIEEGQATIYLNELTPELEVDQGLILGRAEYYIEDVGYLLAILEGGYGLILAISILVLFLAVLIMFIGNIAMRRQRAKEDAELEKELDIQEEILEKKRQEALEFDAPIEEPKPEAETEQAQEELLREDPEEENTQEALEETTNAQAQITGAVESKLAHISIKAPKQQAELLKKLIELAMQQRTEKEISILLTNEEELYTLELECEWKDVPVVSAILTEVQKRNEK